MSSPEPAAQPVTHSPEVKSSAPDILTIPLLRRILYSRYMPLALQVLGLILFGWAVYDGFFGAQAREENFATLGVWWLFFWPVILLSLVFLGRAWCAVCPLGTLTAAAGRWSLGQPFPRTLRNIGLSLLFFVVVLWILRPVLGLSNSPDFTAWFLATWAIAALVVGVIYDSRAFCRFVCPITAPLSVIARVAPLAIRATIGGRLSPACSRCRSHECYKGSQTVEGCPAGEFPAAMESNAQCVWCLKCLKSCPNKGQLQLRLRWPFMELSQVKRPLLLNSLTIISLLGIFLWHMAIGHEPRMPQFFHIWSDQVHQSIPWMEHGDIEYLLTFACVMGAMGSLFAAAAFATSRLARLSYRRSLAISGYACVALVVFRALGYMSGDIITKAGDLLNYIGSALGIHLYFPSALVSWASRPLIPNTGYHLSGILLTIPLVLGLPLAWFLVYRTWRRRASPRGALFVALPNMVAMVIIVAVYELFYLVGYRVIS